MLSRLRVRVAPVYEPFSRASNFIEQYRSLRLLRLTVEGSIVSEIIIALKYYNFIGWSEENTNSHLEQTPRYGILRFIPTPSQFNGRYQPAPFWRKEVGTIQVGFNKDPANEFVVLHEAGHSLHFWRLVLIGNYILICSMAKTILGGAAMSCANIWFSCAVSERLADLHALQHCRKEALAAAAEYFKKSALQPSVFSFPPDTHPSSANRYFLLQRRIEQLDANQGKFTQPSELPLKLPILTFFRKTIIVPN